MCVYIYIYIYIYSVAILAQIQILQAWFSLTLVGLLVKVRPDRPMPSGVAMAGSGSSASWLMPVIHPWDHGWT